MPKGSTVFILTFFLIRFIFYILLLLSYKFGPIWLYAE